MGAAYTKDLGDQGVVQSQHSHVNSDLIIQIEYKINFDIVKDAGCEESEYPVQENNMKCWHFVKATRDYGFIEGAYHVLESSDDSSAQAVDVLKIALFTIFTVFLL